MKKTHIVELTGGELPMLVSLMAQVRSACNRHEYKNDSEIYGYANSILGKVFSPWQESGAPEFRLEKSD